MRPASVGAYQCNAGGGLVSWFAFVEGAVAPVGLIKERLLVTKRQVKKLEYLS